MAVDASPKVTAPIAAPVAAPVAAPAVAPEAKKNETTPVVGSGVGQTTPNAGQAKKLYIVA